MKRIALMTAVLAAAAALPAVAQEEGGAGGRDPAAAGPSIGNRFYISPMGSHTWEDKHRNTDAGYGGAVGIGKQLTPWLSLELSGFFTRLHYGDTPEDTEVWGYGLNGLVFPLSGQPSLYALLGYQHGKAKSHPDITNLPFPHFSEYKTDFADAGVGYLFGPFDWLNKGAIRAEVLARDDLKPKKIDGTGGENNFLDAVLNVGFLIPIGAPPAPPAPPPAEAPPVEVVPVAAPVDSDGDGVTDDLDKCPGTPAGTPVNAEGCPEAPPPPACKTPEPGQPVTLEGCAAGDVIVLRGVNFEFDKSRLTSNARTILDGVASAMAAAPSVNVEVGGHTDARGSDEYNQKLSERRAKSVVDYLKAKGIDGGRMTSKGYGESQPVADNNTDEGRELNRRVELKIAGGGTSAPVEAAPAAAPAEAAPAPAEAPPADAAPAETPPG